MSEGEKCGLSSFLPMSCRGKAEAFARKLHNRLRTLGSEEANASADESSWLGANENPIAISQPRHTSDTDIYLDLGILESPDSPEEEIEESELHKLINNRDRLRFNNEFPCPKMKSRNFNSTNSLDSDDGPFYDTECFVEERLCNGDSNSETSRSIDNGTGTDVNSVNSEEICSNYDESFVTTSDCTPQPSVSLSDDVSTLSLRDEDCSSLENSSLTAEVTDDPPPPPPPNLCHAEIRTDIKYAKFNGNAVQSSITQEETYISHLKINKDLTIECTKVSSEAGEAQRVEIDIEDVDCDDNRTTDSDDFENDDRSPRVRRCSSLKTGKTPPGTPSRKKIVRFADALGLDLAECRTYLDEIPKVPISAYEDLSVDISESSSDNQLIQDMNKFHGIKVDKILMPLFQQPGGMLDFMDKVRDNQVCLENAVVDDPILFAIKGTVRVRNLDFHKSVHIRYTLNSWKTFADVQAIYVENSCDGFSDKFSFVLYAHTVTVGQRLEFACRFQSKGCQYWDNNSGVNYCFQCLPATNNSPAAPITHVDDWGASFYY